MNGWAARTCANLIAGGEDLETPHRRGAVSTAIVEQRVSVIEARAEALGHEGRLAGPGDTDSPAGLPAWALAWRGR